MPNVVLAPQPGSQTLFVTCPAREVLYEGTRGPGKTLALLMDFLQHVGKGHGQHWHGILFRETYKQLQDVIKKTKEWFWQIFPLAVYNKADFTWEFPDGEVLMLRYMASPDDYWEYHGWGVPWIGFEELTNWATPECYDMMKACNRSSHPGMPRKYRATCNPWGKGHGWVKARFIDPAPANTPIKDSAKGWVRVRIHGDLEENKVLCENDPEYINTLDTLEDENLRKAWRFGDWDIAAGGIFTDVWAPPYHVVSPFEIPASWELSRSFDWGSSRPFSVGWWARANGEQPKDTKRTYARGTWVRVAEWYGWNGKANQGCHMLASEVARGILDREKQMNYKVREGVADAAIFDNGSGLSNESIATTMERLGVVWTPANKGPGSRAQGWEKMRELFVNAKQTPMEKPGLVVFETCRQFIRTVPTLLRSDKKPDDVDTDAEDHCLAGDTLIATPAGYRRIDGLRAGELVLTHAGNWTPCRDVRMTQRNAVCVRVTLGSGESFVCTPNHRIWDGSGWVSADSLTGNMGGLDAKHNLGNHSRVSRYSLLPVWDLLPTKGTEIAQESLGRCEWPNTKGLSRSPHRRGCSKQPAGESGAYIGTRPPVGPHVYTGSTGEFISAHISRRDARSRCRMAPLPRGPRVAQEARNNAVTKGGRREVIGMQALQETIHPCRENGNGSLLREQLQVGVAEGKGAGPSDERMPCVQNSVYGEQVLEPGHVLSRVWRSVEKVEPIGVMDVWNMEVDGDRSFTLSSGLSVHNCGDETRYRLFTEVPRAGGVKLSTWA